MGSVENRFGEVVFKYLWWKGNICGFLMIVPVTCIKHGSYRKSSSTWSFPLYHAVELFRKLSKILYRKVKDQSFQHTLSSCLLFYAMNVFRNLLNVVEVTKKCSAWRPKVFLLNQNIPSRTCWARVRRKSLLFKRSSPPIWKLKIFWSPLLMYRWHNVTFSRRTILACPEQPEPCFFACPLWINQYLGQHWLDLKSRSNWTKVCFRMFT